MIRPLAITCGADLLAGTLHPAPGQIGILIVSGGTQIRAGSHRGFLSLAEALAVAGYPVLRFDRRGVGDSDGDDSGFRGSRDDIAAALAAFRDACPDVQRVVGWGLCDGAAALALGADSFDLAGLILANPWTLDSDRAESLPPRAAITRHYRDRLRDPASWRRLLNGGISFPRLLGGLAKVTRREDITDTAQRMATGLGAFAGPVLVLLSEFDATATAFSALWQTPLFADARGRFGTETTVIPGAAHTFMRAADRDAMTARCLEWLARR